MCFTWHWRLRIGVRGLLMMRWGAATGRHVCCSINRSVYGSPGTGTRTPPDNQPWQPALCNFMDLFACLLQVRWSPHCVYAAYAACRLPSVDSQLLVAVLFATDIFAPLLLLLLLHFMQMKPNIVIEATFCSLASFPGYGLCYRSNVYPFGHTTAKSACCQLLSTLLPLLVFIL